MPNMYDSRACNIMQENVNESKMLALFKTLEENDKDIVIAMTESLLERSKDNNTTDMTITPFVAKRLLTVHAN
jgi:hypothetical protein